MIIKNDGTLYTLDQISMILNQCMAYYTRNSNGDIEIKTFYPEYFNDQAKAIHQLNKPHWINSKIGEQQIIASFHTTVSKIFKSLPSNEVEGLAELYIRVLDYAGGTSIDLRREYTGQEYYEKLNNTYQHYDKPTLINELHRLISDCMNSNLEYNDLLDYIIFYSFTNNLPLKEAVAAKPKIQS